MVAEFGELGGDEEYVDECEEVGGEVESDDSVVTFDTLDDDDEDPRGVTTRPVRNNLFTSLVVSS